MEGLLMKHLFVLLTFVLFSSSLAQNMIADIQQPVPTGFGTYHPYPVTIRPNATQCDPGTNLEKVINIADFAFSQDDLALLKKNQFVVTPVKPKTQFSEQTGFNEMFDIYNECREEKIPIFITSDALLHTFHLCFDYILRTCEEKRFVLQLHDLLYNLIEETFSQYRSTQNEAIRSVLTTNMNYLIVAIKLLDPLYAEKINGGPYLEELQLIENAAGFENSPIFNYPEDYSQYIVRGHYTRNDTLRQYFKSMMWLGRMSFSCEFVNDQVSRNATRSALLLLQAMSRLMINGRSAVSIWDDIYQPTVFFVGKSDDIGYYDYLPLAKNVYGADFSQLPVDTFADETLLTSFFDATKSLPSASIGYPGQPKKGFRFMGQRFIPDSWILDELVFDKIPFRTMPTGLDVMMVLGSEIAFDYLPETDKNDPTYVAKLAELKRIFREYPDETWAQNAYWNWLYCLMPLLAPKGTGYPYFMQTEAWTDKDLFAALASWAELRHDTILYAKQSGTETGMPPSAIEEQGYVEPNPHLFGRLASLSEFMIEGLQSRDLLFDNFKTSLEKLTSLCLTLKNIAEKELINIPLSSDDYTTILGVGNQLFNIIIFSQYPSEGPNPWSDNEGLEPMPVVADVHTDANSGLVLEEGVGFPYAIYAICNIEGRPVIAKGAGFSYHEFTWPMNDRLTDEKWREMLKSNNPPKPPLWSDSFISGLETNNPNPLYYGCHKPNSLLIDIEIQPQLPTAGDPVTVNISFNDWFGEYGSSNPPDVWVTSPQGTKTKVGDLQPGSNPNCSWTAQINTENFTAGIVYLDITKSFENGTLDYRSGFKIETSQTVDPVVDQPGEYRLYQNQPNPFNPVTIIRFELPRTSEVSLDIYNINGRHVRGLLAGTFGPGNHTAVWDGKDDTQRTLGSGVYYYRLSAGEYIAVKQMVLLK
jgi:hypothetical protein